jgi:hypothetical protein
LQKSAKLKLVEGVLSAKPKRPLLPPGVCIMDDGKGVVLVGGVVGTNALALLTPFAGVGELLKPKRAALLSPSLDVREKRC